ncbi:hypothetical protein AJ78_09030, partial [Emergomyces pasteurianus Ep9510]
MKIATAFIIVLSFTLDVVSKSVFIKRDIGAYLDALDSINEPMQNLADALQRRDLANVLHLFPIVDDAVRRGIQKLRLEPIVSHDEALMLRVTLSGLVDTTEFMINILVDFRQDIIMAGLRGPITQYLLRLLDGFQNLGAILVASVPSELRVLIEELRLRLLALIHKGIDALPPPETSTTISPTTFTSSTSATTSSMTSTSSTSAITTSTTSMTT